MAQLKLRKAWAETLATIRANYGIYLATSLVALAVSLIFSLGFGEIAAGVYQRVWAILVLSSYIWLVAQILKGKKPKLKEIYYDGSASFVRLVLVLMMLVLYLLPFLAGATIYLYVQQPLSGSSSVEMAAGAGLWGVLALLSFYWLIRSVYAPFLAIVFNPVKAIKESWRLSKKHQRSITMHWLFLVSVLLLIASIILYITALAFSIDTASIQSSLILGRALTATNYLVIIPFYVTYISVILKNVDTKTNRR